MRASFVSLALSSFAVAQSPLSFPTMIWPSPSSSGRLELADLDRDGALDVVQFGPSGLERFSGDGGGGLGAAFPFVAGAWGQDFELADLDSDGWLDVLIAGPIGLTARFSNHAGGTLPAILVAPGPIDSASTADFDGDGRLDLIGWSRASRCAFVALAQGAGFAAPMLVPLDIPWAGPIHCGDFDGDGAADFALVDQRVPPWDTQAVVQLGRGDGTFAQRLAFESPMGFDFRAGDLDGDGADELVALSPGEVVVHRYVQNGRFEKTTLPGTRSLQLRLEDLDADGDLDVACEGGLAPYLVFDNDGLGNLSLIATLGSCEHSAAFALGDLDGDGTSDFVARNNDGGLCVTLALSAQEFRAPRPTRLPRGVEVLAGDLDGDGDGDLVALGSQRVETFLNDGQARFSQSARLAFVEVPIRAGLVDLDGDGDLDLAGRTWSTADAVLTGLNDGSGDFSVALVHAIPSYGDDRFGDVDGDGVPDLVQVASGAVVHRGDGAGGFLTPIATAVASLHGRAALADVDGDGRADLIGCDATSGILVHPGLASGSLGAPIVTPVGAHADVIVSGDFDGDAHADIAFFSSQSQQLWRARGDGAGRFHSFTATPMAHLAGVDTVLVVDRFDGDALDDVLIAPGSGTLPTGEARVWIHCADPSLGFETAAEVAVPRDGGPLCASDFDLDGRADLAVRDSVSLRIELLLQR